LKTGLALIHRRVVFDPSSNFLIRSAGCDEHLQFIGANTGAIEKALIHGTAINIFPVPPDERRATFVEASRRAGKSAKFLSRVTGRLFAKVASPRLYGFQVFGHWQLFQFLPEELHDAIPVFGAAQFRFGFLDGAHYLLVALSRKLSMDIFDFVGFVGDEIAVAIISHGGLSANHAARAT
jgi:hypothetical protein